MPDGYCVGWALLFCVQPSKPTLLKAVCENIQDESHDADSCIACQAEVFDDTNEQLVSLVMAKTARVKFDDALAFINTFGLNVYDLDDPLILAQSFDFLTFPCVCFKRTAPGVAHAFVLAVSSDKG